MSQAETILAHLLTGAKITTYEAYAKWNLTTCGQRITDLKRDGWQIKSEKAKDAPYHEYSLEHCQCHYGVLFCEQKAGTMEHPTVRKHAPSQASR